MAKTFDGPPTLERSGSEHRVGRFSSSSLRFLSPGNGGTEEGVKTIEEGRGEKGGAFFNAHVIVVGKLSFFIYLTHCLFLYAFNYLQFPNVWSLRWVTCLCLSYGMAMVFDKVCPQKMKKYFGF